MVPTAPNAPKELPPVFALRQHIGRPMLPTAPNQPEEQSPDTWRRHIGQPLGSVEDRRTKSMRVTDVHSERGTRQREENFA